MKKLFLILISALSLCSTTRASADEQQIDIRSISNMLADIARAPLSTTHGQGYATALVCQGENILHQRSNLKLHRIGNDIEIIDMERAQTVWQRDLANVLYASWDRTGEYVEVCCRGLTDFYADDTEHLVYRVAYISALQHLNRRQLAFIRTCCTYWTNNKQPFLVVDDTNYSIYQTLPAELKRRDIFMLSDALQRRARKDYYKSWATLPIDALRYLVTCCRMKGV